MWLPATPGWGPLVLVGAGPSPLLAEVRRFAGRGPSLPAVGSGWEFPRHSWLKAPGAVPRHSWLGACWCWWWVVPLHSWLRVLGAVPRHSWLGSAGCGCGRLREVWWGVSRVACVCGAASAGVCVVCLWRWCGCGCAFRVCWRVCGVWRFVSLSGAWCWCRCGCGCGWCVLWAVPRHSWRSFLLAFSRHSWLGFAAGGGGCSSPLLAEGPWVRSLATPGWRPPAAVVRVCLPLLGVVLVAVPRHSWLGSAGRGGGRFRGVGWGFLVVCVFVARCVRVWCLCWCACRGFVVVAWVSGCGCVFRVCWCVRVSVWVCGWGPLGVAACVGVGVVGVCRGWSLATPGGGS